MIGCEEGRLRSHVVAESLKALIMRNPWNLNSALIRPRPKVWAKGTFYFPTSAISILSGEDRGQDVLEQVLALVGKNLEGADASMIPWGKKNPFSADSMIFLAKGLWWRSEEGF